MFCGLVAPALWAQERYITVASTTSTEQSGLFGHLLPAFEKSSGIKVRVVALGTGQALDMARRGDADVVFVHDKTAEEKFVAEGFGMKRQEVMVNDFILVNPVKHPHVKQVDGQKFIDWVVSPAGQQAIADYKIGGEQLFFPNASK